MHSRDRHACSERELVAYLRREHRETSLTLEEGARGEGEKEKREKQTEGKGEKHFSTLRLRVMKSRWKVLGERKDNDQKRNRKERARNETKRKGEKRS